MSFHVGQKVVCINDGNYFNIKDELGSGYDGGLRNGNIYTITMIEDGKFLHLAEMARNAWNKCRFRPVVEKKTDISIFQEMLTKTPATIEA